MKCPACKTATLQDEQLDDGPRADGCNACGGRWISSTRYVAWVESRRKPGAPPHPLAPEAAHAVDSSAALLCPECGHLMIKFHVGGEHDFALDRCNHCNGEWLDRGEWEALRSRGLHEQIARVCSPAWQHALTREAMRRALATRLRAVLGPADFDRIEEMRRWIQAHPHRALLMAHLIDEEPHGAPRRPPAAGS